MMNEGYGYVRNSVTLAQAAKVAELWTAEPDGHASRQSPGHQCLNVINTETLPEIHKFLHLVVRSV